MSALKPTLANWNGEILPLEEVKVSVLDRAFLFGDAIYEAMRIYSGKPWLADEHFERLSRSLSEVRIAADVKRLRGRMDETIRASGVREGLVYLEVTRGQGPRSHAWKTAMTPNELVWVQDYGRDLFADTRRQGIGVVLVSDRRWGRCDVKSVNLLANVMACQEAYEAGCIEALLVDAEGRITEATHSSFFAVMDGVVRTSPNDSRVLPGVTRNWVAAEMQRQGLRIEETPLLQRELERVDELFLTGTSIEVMPVVAVDGRPINGGKAGPAALKMLDAYQSAIRAFVG